MREIEKAMRQMDKGDSRHTKPSRQFSEAALLSPTCRTDSGRSTPTGRISPPGTNTSGLTTPTGRVTPPGSTTLTGRATPPGVESGLTTPTSRVTPYGTTTSGRSIVDAATPSELMTHASHVSTSLAKNHAAESFKAAHHDKAAADVAVGDVGEEADAEAEALVPRLLSSKSSVKDAVLLYEGSHPVTSRQLPINEKQLPFSKGHSPTSNGQVPNSKRQGSVSIQQPSTSFSTDALTHDGTSRQFKRLATSKSSVPYQTKGLSEGVYGKLYSSKSSMAQDGISAAWLDDAETSDGPVISDGVSTSGGGRLVANGAGGAVSSGIIGRSGGGIGRRGTNKFAIDANFLHNTQSEDLPTTAERWSPCPCFLTRHNSAHLALVKCVCLHGSLHSSCDGSLHGISKLEDGVCDGLSDANACHLGFSHLIVLQISSHAVTGCSGLDL